jgi:RHS repeat-associated protein
LNYSPVGLAQATLGNGVVDTRQYTNRTWLQSLNAKTTTGPVIYSEALTYYPNGNLQAVTDPVNGNWTYTYDQTNRILTGISTNTEQGCQFTYDPFGNRKTSAPDQGTCTSPSFSFTASTTNHIDGYCYDGAGNLNDAGSCPPSGSNHQYFYDGYNQLLSPNFNQTGRAAYTVDAFGHRVGKSLNGTWARIYLYGLDGNPVAEMNGTGAWQQTNVHVGGQFLAEYQGTDTDFQHSDHLGTIRAQSNSAGTRITTCSNLPFGDSLNCNGNTNPSGYHFTGKERDAESGLDNFGARYYASTMGRFLSPDWAKTPEGVPYADLSNPQTLNLYGYVGNNPLSKTDSDGHQELVPTPMGPVPLPYPMAPQQQFTPQQSWQVGQDITNFFTTAGQVIREDAATISNAISNIFTSSGNASNAPAPTDPAGATPAATTGAAPTPGTTPAANAPLSTLPRAPNGDYLPAPDAQGPHSTLGTRPSTSGGAPYTQGATFDENGKFQGRTDVTDHGRPQIHTDPHFHPATSPNGVGRPQPIPQD